MNDESVQQDIEQAPETSLRDDLEAAFDAADKESAPAPEPTVEREPQEAPAGDRARDEAGRFARKAEAGDHGASPAKVGVQPGGTAKPAIVAPPGPPVIPPVAAPPVERAPQSWKPLAREHWGQLPQDVRAEVVRREREVAQALQDSSQARQTAQAFQTAVGPYEAMIRAEGSDPLRAVANLLQTAAALRTAPPVQRARLVADIVRTFGIPIDALDSALAGQPMPQAQAQAAPPRDPRVDQLFAQLQGYQQQQERALNQQAASQVETFSQDKEFFGDLRGLMADVIEIAARNGEQLSLDDAYGRAVAMRPDIAKVVQQREAAAAAANRTRSTQRAQRAASSVRSSNPVSPNTDRSGPRSLREDIEAAFEAAEGR